MESKHQFSAVFIYIYLGTPICRAPTSAEMRDIASSMMDRGVEGGYVTMTSLSGAWASWTPWTPAAAAAIRAREVRKETIFMMTMAKYEV